MLTLNAFNAMYLTNRFVNIRSSTASPCAKIFCAWSEIMHLTLTASLIPVFLDCKEIWHWHFWWNIDITRGSSKNLKYVTKKRSHKHNVKDFVLEKSVKSKKNCHVCKLMLNKIYKFTTKSFARLSPSLSFRCPLMLLCWQYDALSDDFTMIIWRSYVTIYQGLVTRWYSRRHFTLYQLCLSWC